MSLLVDVLLDEQQKVIAIFQSRHEALLHPDWDLGRVRLNVSRADAVYDIRRAVFERDDYTCRHCGEYVGKNGHLDEVIPRGLGGSVSVANGQVLCAKCHILGPESKHGGRAPRFSQGEK